MLLTIASPLHAEQTEDYDYFIANRTMIRNGVQAILTCNGLFTSHRTLEQIFAQELAYLPAPVGNASGGDYIIDSFKKAVAIGGRTGGAAWVASPPVRRVYAPAMC